MRILVAAMLVCACKGDPPASPPPSPGSGSTASTVPPADAAPAPGSAVPKALAADIAVILPNEVQVLRKGTAPGSKPASYPTPKPTEGPAIWSQSGELFIGLKGGDIAHLAGDTMDIVKLTKPLKKLARGHGDVIKRDVGFGWTHDDGMIAGADGSVWLYKCDYWYRGDADGCDSRTNIQLAPTLRQAKDATKPRSGGGLPKVPAPPGFAITKTDDVFTCEHGPTKLEVHQDGGKPDLIAWLTPQPARAILDIHFADESGEIGDRDEYWLVTDCEKSEQIELKSSADDVYAVRPIVSQVRPVEPWIVVQAGVEVARFKMGEVVLGNGEGEEEIPH